jgi:hypothetical protein
VARKDPRRLWIILLQPWSSRIYRSVHSSIIRSLIIWTAIEDEIGLGSIIRNTVSGKVEYCLINTLINLQYERLEVKVT